MTYINSEILLDDLQNEMRAICQFSPDQEFTMKWIDEEGCTTHIIHTVFFYYDLHPFR